MNWNNEGYDMDDYPLHKDCIAFEQCNWPAGLSIGDKPTISFYNIFSNETDLTTSYTVAIWRKKKCAKCNNPAQKDTPLCIACEQREHEYQTEKFERGF